MGGKGLLGVVGLWKGCRVNINVYAPIKVEEKQEVWNILTKKMWGKEDERWCICGDFNAIRCEEERRGQVSSDRRREMREFNEFINQQRLVDFPLERKKFTWYKENGKSCSRIDRFLVSSEWVSKWPNLVQVGLKRKVSDHAVIMLKEDAQDWGPKPFKFLNGWMKEKGFKEMVENAWKSHNAEGWSGFILKEKLKAVKVKIKEWHKEQFGNIEKKIEMQSNNLIANWKGTSWMIRSVWIGLQSGRS